MPRERLLKCCAWAVHLYTASGAVAALLSINYISHDDFRGAFIVMGAAIFIDSSDGPLARALRISDRIPIFDGALLDNVIDYLNYVVVPVFLMLRAGIIGHAHSGLAVGGFVMVASAYGFCRVDAKTEDNYFRGFPSYWNLVALYLFCLGLPPLVNTIVLVILGVMVFVPIKYIYPNRTELMRPLTLTLAIIWATVTAAMLPMLPHHNPVMLYTSLAFVVYYFAMSFALHAHPARLARRTL